MAFICINDFSYTYPMGNKPSLSNINLEIEKGSFIALMGADGAGKSSLCYAVTGLIPHFYRGRVEGSIVVKGMDTAHTSLGKLIESTGFILANPFNQFSGTRGSVFEEIAVGMENIGIKRDLMGEKIERVMALTDTTYLKDRDPVTLSGGEAQKVAIASILVMEPEILVLDEPASQLDPRGVIDLTELLRKLNSRGITIILSTQSFDHLYSCVDRVVVLANGRVLIEGAPSDVISSSLLPLHGVEVPRCTTLAGQARLVNLWKGKTLPVSIDEAVNGFLK